MFLRIAMVVGILIVAVVILWKRGASRKQERFSGPISSWRITDSWSIGHGDHDGKPIITRCNMGLWPAVGNAAFAKQLGIAVPLNHPTADGLPEAEESAQLYDLEEEIGRGFTVNNESLFACIITTGNMREFVLYTSNEAAAGVKAEQLAREIKHHEIQYVLNDDPGWNVFKQLAGR
jgi:hypothetical protein